jgi:hypothetical protein
VTFGLDEGPDVFDFAGFADKEGAADDAHVGAAHELFFLPGAEFSDGFVRGIAEQWEIQFLFGLERSLGFNGIGAHAEDGNAEFLEFFFCVTKLGRFDCSTGGIGLGVEEEENALAGEVFEREFFAFVGLEAEGGSFGVDFEHGEFLASDVESDGTTASAAFSQTPLTGAIARNNGPAVSESAVYCRRLKNIRKHVL